MKIFHGTENANISRPAVLTLGVFDGLHLGHQRIMQTVVERAGVRVGILGLTTPGSAIWDRANVEGTIEFRDIVESARRFWPELERASDIQIAVMHSGLGPGSSYDEAATGVPPEDAGGALAEALPGLEAIFLGHSHRVIPADTVAGVLVTQAGRWAEALAVVSLELERSDGTWTVVDQSATYPMQLMLGIYAFPAENDEPEGTYPKELVVDYVRGYRLRDGG